MAKPDVPDASVPIEHVVPAVIAAATPAHNRLRLDGLPDCLRKDVRPFQSVNG